MDNAAPVTQEDSTKQQTTAEQNAQIEHKSGSAEHPPASVSLYPSSNSPQIHSSQSSKFSLIIAVISLLISLAIAVVHYQLVGWQNNMRKKQNKN